jgi:hypothetical protein
MLIYFLNIKGITHFELVPPKQSTKLSSIKLCNVYGSAFAEKDQIFGPPSGV